MITVCIPAYRAEAFIADTVVSVLAQRHDDLILRIAIDPPDTGPDTGPDRTEAALEPFRDDPRVFIRTNPRRLGWAENLNALLAEVTTDTFAPLPHDDLWAPDYLSVLHPLLQASPAASVAYGDLSFFGATEPGRTHSVRLPRGQGRARHLLHFLLEGAHAMPWRGLTRRSALAVTGGFPCDPDGGFAVEAEYALGLLEAGEAIHVPRVLYSKRVFAPETRSTASIERLAARPATELALAWDRHRVQMEAGVERMLAAYAVPAEEAALVRDACLAAMLLRRHAMVAPGLTGAERTAIEAALARTATRQDPLAQRLGRRLHHALASGPVAP